MPSYPLIFKFKHTVKCGQFSAVVVGDGRVLMVPEDGAWWCHGVQPGGLTASGETPDIAYKKFRESLGWFLEDVASETLSYQGFEKRVMAFMTEEDPIEKQAWLEAVEAIRSQRAQLEAPFAKMETRPADSVLSVRIESVEVFADEVVELAKAA